MPDETPSENRTGSRPKRWWIAPLWKSGAVVYAPQLTAFVFGPLTECSHCVVNYLKYFPVMPGALMSLWIDRELPFDLPGDNDGWVMLGLGGLITAVILFAVMMIGGWLKGWKRWLFFLLVAGFSTVNALFFSALLRA